MNLSFVFHAGGLSLRWSTAFKKIYHNIHAGVLFSLFFLTINPIEKTKNTMYLSLVQMFDLTVLLTFFDHPTRPARSGAAIIRLELKAAPG